jgi:hypothetical protein
MKYMLIKLFTIWSILIISLTLFGEYAISRPLNHFIQVPLIFMAVVLTVGSIKYTVDLLFKKHKKND